MNPELERSNAAQQTADVYYSVIDDVIEKMRQTYLDEGVEEQVLQDLKATWTARLLEQNSMVKSEASSDIPNHGHSSHAAPHQPYQFQPSHSFHPQQTDGPGSSVDGSTNNDVTEENNADTEGSEEEDETPNDLLICQYDKLSRKQSKWKAVFRRGILKIGDKDLVFDKMSGDFSW